MKIDLKGEQMKMFHSNDEQFGTDSKPVTTIQNPGAGLGQAGP